MKGLLLLSFVFLGFFGFAGQDALASDGLVIHTAEFGVGKFHRYDNKQHAYGTGHAWSPFILADSVNDLQTLTQKNADGSYTVFFSSLADMVQAVQKVSQTEGKKVSVLNVHGHGLPGAMWFPKDSAALNSWSCGDWKDAASGRDSDNYDQYYSPVSVGEIEQIRGMSNSSGVHMPCTTGLSEWQDVVAHAPTFKDVFADDAQVHFVSCVVGLGSQGEQFTKGIAALLFAQHAQGQVQTSMNFGLGDWSISAGMGFWDYQTDAQVSHDNSLYTKNHRDSEIAQKGTIRLVSQKNGGWTSTLIGQRDVMSLAFEASVKGAQQSESLRRLTPRSQIPTRIRVPGTNSYVSVEVQ
jgi:hypothetical protein